ncbi:MAG: peptidoglycan DD-metalloendopeptidase family protein [Bdellovibrionales bacterium]|nr:peptidoglycan DD-metalloendopeptidase family protein [Oligoflexia bacterium]
MKLSFLLLATLIFNPAVAQTPESRANLNAKLDQVRTQRLAVEQALIDAEKSKKSTEQQLKRLKTLQKLQTQEKALTEQRLETLEKYLKELHVRREDVQHRIDTAKVELRLRFSKLVHPLLAQNEALLRGDEGEGEKRLKEKVISSVALSQLKDLEGMYADLQDAEDIESRIEQEKQQINSLMQDISEQESLIKFHQQIRQDLTQDKHAEHLQQLEEYRKLKVSEVEIEKMVSGFQNRQIHEHEEDRKKIPFMSFRPKSLPWPMRGKVADTYGQHKDPASGLNIFKKGIEILTMSDNAPVTAVLNGKVQYSGEIAGKGKVIILEHPHSIYTIYGGLKEAYKAVGDEVKAQESLGKMESEQPLYFEIRARNVAIDPVKWLQ